jgi:hypothetical protein
MRLRIASASMIIAGLLIAVSAGPAAAQVPSNSNASCAGQFTSAVAPVAVPFGQTVVVPEVQQLTLGGPNLGQEVKALLATANREACPVTP